MPTRHLVFLPSLAAVALLPAPAMAQESRAGEIAEKLRDPMTQYAVAGMLSAASKAVLELRIEPFIKVMEGIGSGVVPDLPPDATVGDLAGTDASQIREKLIEHVPRAMDAMGEMAGAADEIMPEIESAAKKLKDAIPAQ